MSTWLCCLKIGVIRDILLKSLKLLQICSLLRQDIFNNTSRCFEGEHAYDLLV